MTATPSTQTSTERTALPLLTDTEVATVLREYRPTATRAVRSVLGISTEEEDLVQEALTRLVIRLRQPGEISIGVWTWRVAHNVAVDHLRTRRATPTDVASLDRGVGEGLDTLLFSSELAAAISQGLAKLPNRQRDALLAQAALDGGRGGHAIVAANLGVSAKAAEGILARARRSLRRELDRMGVREGVWVGVGAVVLRSLRRLARPTAAVGGALTIAVVSVVATSVLVFRGAEGHGPTIAPLTVQGPASPATTAHDRRSAPGSASSASIASKSSGVSTPPVTRPEPMLPPSPSVSAPSAGHLPSVTLSGSPDPTLPAVSVPAVTLPSLSAPGSLAVPSLPPATLPTVTVPALPSVTVPPVVRLPALPPALPGIIL